MSDNALYFPSINLPQDAWSARALLYWDGLATIVPMRSLEEPDELSYFMQGLLSEGLVRTVIPAQHLYRCRDFSEDFINYLDSLLMSRSFHERGAPGLGYKRIHAEKLEDIPEFLVQRGLAFEVAWGWYDVREDIADRFMFYLAARLGGMADVNAVPVTDGKAFVQRRWDTERPDPTPHRNKARQVILNNLLPAPAEGVSVEKLLRFKQDHGHLLPKFRLAVEDHCIAVASMSDASLRAASTENFIAQCRLELKEIEEAMRPSFGKIFFTSLLPIVTAGITFDGRGGARDYAAGAMTLASAIYGTVSVVREARNLRQPRPLAYVAQVSEFARSRAYVPE